MAKDGKQKPNATGSGIVVHARNKESGLLFSRGTVREYESIEDAAEAVEVLESRHPSLTFEIFQRDDRKG